MGEEVEVQAWVTFMAECPKCKDIFEVTEDEFDQKNGRYKAEDITCNNLTCDLKMVVVHNTL